ncbi:hypothetical protein TrVGV298_008508 [Trichoderma virens]|nr:hypothetical protein TrVGV298_008508 [Trichoderma virens]
MPRKCICTGVEVTAAIQGGKERPEAKRQPSCTEFRFVWPQRRVAATQPKTLHPQSAAPRKNSIQGIPKSASLVIDGALKLAPPDTRPKGPARDLQARYNLQSLQGTQPTNPPAFTRSQAKSMDPSRDLAYRHSLQGRSRASHKN